MGYYIYFNKEKTNLIQMQSIMKEKLFPDAPFLFYICFLILYQKLLFLTIASPCTIA